MQYNQFRLEVNPWNQIPLLTCCSEMFLYDCQSQNIRKYNKEAKFTGGEVYGYPIGSSQLSSKFPQRNKAEIIC